MKRLVLFGFATVYMCSCTQKTPLQSSYEIISPDGRVAIGFTLEPSGQMAYAVSFDRSQIISPSGLSLEMKEGGILGTDMELKNVEQGTVDETYPVYAGKSSSARNHCKEMRFFLKEKNEPFRELLLEFRAYNDGAAFRYIVPDQKAIGSFDLVAEHTQFNLNKPARVWPMFVPSFHQNYEFHFNETIPDSVTPGRLVGLPLSFRIHEKLAGSITEAGLTGFPALYLTGEEGTPYSMKARLVPHPADNSTCLRSDKGFKTPWRVVMTAEKLLDLIPSNIVMNLNEPCRIPDPSWIRPGKTAWDWWSGQVAKGVDFTSGMNNETMKHYIDFASEFGLEYMLVDAGWYGNHRAPDADVTSMIPEIDIPGLVKYAGERNVDLLIWLNWEHLLPRMEEAFALYESWGVKGVKIDYMDRDDQEMVDFYHNTTELAAKYHLLVNYHGAYKPTGIRRTWPNLITREGILGLEYLKWSDKAHPLHNVTIPFTRMLVGPMDYTPGGFNQVPPDKFFPRYIEPFALGTRCHQLAMYVVYESPLQMVSDHPSAYRGQPGSEFLKQVPASWDETLPVEGEIAEYIVLARRKGSEWFVGAMTNDESRDLTITLDFLESGREYTLILFEDISESVKTPGLLNQTERKVRKGDIISVWLAPGGGMAAAIF